MLLQKIERIFRKKRCYCNFDVDKNQLQNLIRKGAILVDVRSPQEYKEDHLDNSISIPSYDVKQKANNLLQDKNQTIIVYCSTGHRSKKAQKILKQMGYKYVYNLCDGLE